MKMSFICSCRCRIFSYTSFLIRSRSEGVVGAANPNEEICTPTTLPIISSPLNSICYRVPAF